MKGRVIAVAGDPGGAEAVAPVIQRLREEGVLSVDARAYSHAQSVWANRGVEFASLPDQAANVVLDVDGLALVLTATSNNQVNWERRYILAAKSVDVASIAVLDFWTNYVDRFADAHGRLACLPDRIAVMDVRARDEMIAAGFPPSHLIVTGQPAFDDLAQTRAAFSDAQRSALRAHFGVSSHRRLVVFVSQPLRDLYGPAEHPHNEMHPGYDENQVLLALWNSLERIGQTRGINTILLIRPHLREDADAFPELRGRFCEARISRDFAARDVVISADLVVGMTSVLLLEASLLGCVTASLQPGLRHVDPLPSNASGLSRAVYDLEDIPHTIESLLTDECVRQELRARCGSVLVGGSATANVIQLCYQAARL